jgi:1,4-alpha-glucan branching enzyme
LHYFAYDPVHRKHHHNQITFRLLYAFHENFVLPLSHDEVVHGKGSLINKMPGDHWQKFANLRSLFGYMYAQAGKKLLFMGGEFGQWAEWNHDKSLDWHLLQEPLHAGLHRWVSDLNALYRREPALHELDCDPAGFEWVDCNDVENSVFSVLRWGQDKQEAVLIVCNFTPIPRHNYRVGVPTGGFWQELINSDAGEYGGSGVGNYGGVEADSLPCHDRAFSIELSLPPLAVAFFKAQPTAETASSQG